MRRELHHLLHPAGAGPQPGRVPSRCCSPLLSAMAGMNPTAVASAGRMTSVTSMGIMLPVAASGAILMPWVIGVVAESAGLAAGMDDQHRALRGSGHLCDPRVQSFRRNKE
ncbi:MAG: hypothetical protein ACLVJH_01455 [Faecalibacterium prausnitzii]